MAQNINTAIACSPYIGGCDFREIARQYVDSFYQSLGFKTYYGTHDGNIFNRSAAKNAAVKYGLSQNPDAKAIIIFDSDTFLADSNSLLEAVSIAIENDEIVIPYTEHHWIYESEIGKVFDGSRYSYHKGISGLTGGCIVVPVTIWNEVGGFDERFISWGGEDRAFYFACNTMRGNKESIRLPGKSFHIYHPRSEDSQTKFKGFSNSLQLGYCYKEAAGVKERSGILSENKMFEGLQPDRDKIIAILTEDFAPLSDNALSLGRMCTEQDLETQYTVLFDGKKSVIVKKGDEKYNRLLSNNEKWRELNVRYSH